MSSNKKNHILMFILLILWTIDAVIVSSAVESLNPIVVIFLKTLFSLPVLAVCAHVFKQNMAFPQKRDIPQFILCAFLGDIAYFFFEYSAYNYLSIGMVTVLLGMCPLISYLIDCVVKKKRPEVKILVLIAISIIGLGIAVLSEGSDDSVLGYVCCALAIGIMICYGYAIKKLGNKYDLIPLTFYASTIAVIMTLPFAIIFWPQETIETSAFINIVIMGIVMNGFGYILENNGVLTLGMTICSLYLNMLPVFTSVAGMLFLNETMSLRQIIGSVIVMISGFAVIIINGRSAANEESE